MGMVPLIMLAESGGEQWTLWIIYQWNAIALFLSYIYYFKIKKCALELIKASL